MNKTELIAAVAEKTGMSKKDTEAVIAATLGTITAALHEETLIARTILSGDLHAGDTLVVDADNGALVCRVKA